MIIWLRQPDFYTNVRSRQIEVDEQSNLDPARIAALQAAAPALP
jgi:hypothetical protein